MNDFYYCPACYQKLLAEDNTYLCHACGSKYSIEGGVPDFRSHDDYWGVLNRDTVKKILAHAQEKDWQEALKIYLQKEHPEYYDYLLGTSWSCWHLILPLPRESVVLDLGCRWGGSNKIIKK